MTALLRSLQTLTACVLLFAVCAGVYAAISAFGTSLALPGLGTILPGALVAAFAGITLGALAGLGVGLIVGLVVLFIFLITGGNAVQTQTADLIGERLRAMIFADCALAVFGFSGFVAGLIFGTGTNVMLPGLGLVVSGSVVAGFIFAGVGIFAGALLALLLGWLIPFKRTAKPMR